MKKSKLFIILGTLFILAVIWFVIFPVQLDSYCGDSGNNFWVPGSIVQIIQELTRGEGFPVYTGPSGFQIEEIGACFDRYNNLLIFPVDVLLVGAGLIIVGIIFHRREQRHQLPQQPKPK